MLTEQITKSQFVVEVLNRDIANIYKAQLLIARHNIRLTGTDLKQVKRAGPKMGERKGKLISSLASPKYAIFGRDGKFQAEASIPIHTRFLDMKKHGNWMIYNRQVWGILYRNAMLDIKYGYKRRLHDHVGDALRAAFESTKK